jgi:hypothetical protein
MAMTFPPCGVQVRIIRRQPSPDDARPLGLR